MSSFTRRGLLGGFAIATGAGLMAVPAMAQFSAEVYVPMAPPPPRAEVVPVLPRERVEIELAPKHGCEHQHAIARIGKSAEATADHVLHAPRDGELEAGLVQPPLGLQQAHDLAHEERVALALAEDGLYQRRRRRALGGLLDEAGDIAFRQAAEDEASRDRLPG